MLPRIPCQASAVAPSTPWATLLGEAVKEGRLHGSRPRAVRSGPATSATTAIFRVTLLLLLLLCHALPVPLHALQGASAQVPAGLPVPPVCCLGLAVVLLVCR